MEPPRVTCPKVVGLAAILVASCVPPKPPSDAATVNAQTWRIVFDRLDGFPPRVQRPAMDQQPQCDSGCTCSFYPAIDTSDGMGERYAQGMYREVCNAKNLQLECSIRFESNTKTIGGCQFGSITQPGFASIVEVQLESHVPPPSPD